MERPESSSPDEIKAGKYVAPGRRKQHNTQAGKLIRPTQINSSNINISSNTPPISTMSIQQSSNSKYIPMVPHSAPSQQIQKTSGESNNYRYIIK